MSGEDVFGAGLENLLKSRKDENSRIWFQMFKINVLNVSLIGHTNKIINVNVTIDHGIRGRKVQHLEKIGIFFRYLKSQVT